MAELARKQAEFLKASDINALTAKVFSLTDNLKALYRNEHYFPANDYADAEKGFYPSILFGAEKDLYYTSNESYASDYVQGFYQIDDKAYLRGNYKRTEVGLMFPEIVTPEEGVKPGDKLVTPKQHYIPFYQDQSVPIPDIHARTYIDFRQFDHALNFNDAQDYFRVRNACYRSIAQADYLLNKLCIDTYIISAFGGHLFSYDTGHPLYRFFVEASENGSPDEKYSKRAKEFFKPDSKVMKILKEISLGTQKINRNEVAYLTNVVTHEVIGSSESKQIPKREAMFADVSSKDKCLAALREGFLGIDSSNKSTQALDKLRRSSLESLIDQIDGNLRTMTRLSATNGAGHSGKDDNKDKLGYTLQAQPQNLVVFMNEDDLEDSLGTLGSSSMGPFTERLNLKVQRWMNRGVTFGGLDYIIPGHVFIADRIAFSMRRYFNNTYDQFHAFDLVNSIINHTYTKPVMYEKIITRVIRLGKGQKFKTGSFGASKNLPSLVES